MYVNLVNGLNTPYLIILSHPMPSSSSITRPYVNLVDFFKTSHLIILSHPLHSSPESTWTRLFVYIFVFWLSYPTIFIGFQGVRQLAQLFEYPTYDFPIPSSSSISRLYVNMLNCLSSPHLIILSHPFHPTPGRTWTCSIVWIPPSSDHPISPVSRAYVNLINCLNIRSYDYPIPSSQSISRAYVNFSNFFNSSDHLSHPIVSSISRAYVKFFNWFKTDF